MDLEHQKLAFTLTMAHRVAGADEQRDHSEIEKLRALFPGASAAGFVDAEGNLVSEKVAPVFDAACRDLPSRLAHADRLSLISVLNDVCLSDAQVTRREVNVIREAAAMMGIAQAELERLLDLTMDK